MKKTVRIVVTFICCCTFFLSFFHADLTRADSIPMLPSFDPINQNVIWNRYSTVLTTGQREVANYIAGTSFYAYLSGRNITVNWQDWSEKNYASMVHFFEDLGKMIWELTVPPTMATLDFSTDLLNYLSDVLGFVTSAGRDGFSGGLNFAVNSDSFGVPYNKSIINGYNRLFKSTTTLTDLWNKYFPEGFTNPTIVPKYDNIFTNIVNEINKPSFSPDNIFNVTINNGFVNQSEFLNRYRQYKLSSEWINIDALNIYFTIEDDDQVVFYFADSGVSSVTVNKDKNLAAWRQGPPIDTSSYWLDANVQTSLSLVADFSMKNFYTGAYVRSYAYMVTTDKQGNIDSIDILVDQNNWFSDATLLSDPTGQMVSNWKFHLPFTPFDNGQYDASLDWLFKKTFDIQFGNVTLNDCLVHNVKMYEYVEQSNQTQVYVFDDNDNPTLDTSGDSGYSIEPPEDGVIDIIGITHDITPPDPTSTPSPGEPDPPVSQPVTGTSVIVDNYYTYEGDQYTYNEFNYTYNYYYYPSDDTFTRPSLDAVINFLGQSFDNYSDGDNPFDGSFDYDNKSPFQYMSYMWKKTSEGLDFLEGCLHSLDQSGVSIVFMGGLVALGVAGFFSKLLG